MLKLHFSMVIWKKRFTCSNHKGFEVKGKKELVCKLKKSFYGLKQTPRQWYKKFNSFMVGHGYQRTALDYCHTLKLSLGVSFHTSSPKARSAKKHKPSFLVTRLSPITKHLFKVMRNFLYHQFSYPKFHNDKKSLTLNIHV